MTQFEFVQVTIAIILGLGITDIVRNLGEQVRLRERLAIYPVQVLASTLLLLVTLIYLWFFWQAAEVRWTLPLFALQAAPAIALAMAAQLLRVDCSDARTPREQYHANARYAYLSWALAPTFGFLFEVSTDSGPEVNVTRLVVIVLLLSLCVLRQQVVHLAVLSVLMAFALIGPLTTLFAL